MQSSGRSDPAWIFWHHVGSVSGVCMKAWPIHQLIQDSQSNAPCSVASDKTVQHLKSPINTDLCTFIIIQQKEKASIVWLAECCERISFVNFPQRRITMIQRGRTKCWQLSAEFHRATKLRPVPVHLVQCWHKTPHSSVSAVSASICVSV